MSPQESLELTNVREALAASEAHLRRVLEGSDDGRGMSTDLRPLYEVEAALRDSQASHSALLLSMRDGVFVAQDRCFVFANPALPAMLGYAPDDFIGLPFSAVIAPEFLTVWTERFDQRIRGAGDPPSHYELRFLTRSGDELWVEVRASPTQYRGRAGVTGILRDITERRQANARIESLKQRVEMAVRGAGYGVWEFALDAQLLIWDAQMHALYGHTPASFDGSVAAWRRCLHPEDRDAVDARFADLLAGVAVDDFRFRIVRASDGAVRHIESNGVLQRDAAGQARRLVGMNRDVTGQMLADERLRQSEQRWKFALDVAGDGVWDWDIPGQSVRLSARCSELLGRRSEEGSETLALWRSRVHPDEIGRAESALGAYFEGRSASFELEHRMRRDDGAWIWLLSRGLVVQRDDAGQPLRMVGTYTDLTQRKRAEAARAELEARLRDAQKMEAIGTLAGGVAHDFNNLLAAIMGNVAMAQDEIGADHPARASLDHVRRAGVRARSLVQQILAFSRRQPQQLRCQRLQPIVEEALGLLHATLPASVSIDAHMPADELRIETDATQMQQVLLNLCTNAWHAMKGRPGRITVALSECRFDGSGPAPPAALALGAYARLSVSDTGCGMSAEEIARIFEPFYTSKPVGQGTGLGLSVVHGIVIGQGGAITVESQPGSGSRFDLYFPLRVDDGASDLGALPDTAPLQRGRGEHLVYIDDDELMVVTVERLLQRAGYRVSSFHNAHAAIALVREQPSAVDLVITDFNMPECSGTDVARELAALRADLPVIISSGYISPELRADARLWGVRALIEKEHTVERLQAAVQRVLGGASD